MKFDFFLKNSSKIEKIKVNSNEAHLELAPDGRSEFSKDYKTENTRKAAVMAIVSPINDIAHLTLIVRSKYDGAHSGQVAFAGGKWETADTSLLDTAYREVEEEIGVAKNCLKFSRALTPLYVPVSDFRVYPYLAYSKNKLNYIPQQSEVDQVITLPLATLFSENALKKTSIKLNDNVNVEVPAFVVNGYTIWGATSMILNELKQIIVKSMQ